MKRFMTLMLFIGIALTSLAQKNVDEIIDQYSRDKEVQYIHLPRLLIQAGVAQMKTSKTTDVARNINDLRILLLDNCRNGKRKKFRKKVERLTQNGYQEFAKMKDADDDIRKATLIKSVRLQPSLQAKKVASFYKSKATLILKILTLWSMMCSACK